MKIIQYIPHGAVPDVRGFAPAIVAQNLAKNLKFGKPFIISNQEEYERQNEESVFGAVHRIKESPAYARLFKKITKLDPYPLHARAAKISEKLEADIFHAHQTEFDANDFLRKCKKKPAIAVHIHAMRNFDPSRGIADVYFAVSEYTKKRMVEERGYPVGKVEVLYNGFDKELFFMPSATQKNSLKSILGIPSGGLVVGYVGRKQQVKGFYNFLRTVKHLRQSGKEVYAVCVGPTPWDAVRDEDYDDEQRLLGELKMQSWFFDMPPLSHDRLHNIYKIIDILLFPTYFGGEQHPIVAVEGLATGCVVISSNLFSLSETIDNGKTGFLLEDPKDIDELIAVTENAIEGMDSLLPMRKAAQISALEKFEWTGITAKLEKIYFDKLISR